MKSDITLMILKFKHKYVVQGHPVEYEIEYYFNNYKKALDFAINANLYKNEELISIKLHKTYFENHSGMLRLDSDEPTYEWYKDNQTADRRD